MAGCWSTTITRPTRWRSTPPNRWAWRPYLDAEHQALHDRLATEPGKVFDTDLVNAMLQDHQKMIGAYEKAANEDNDAAGRYASDVLPNLRKHMEEVTKLAQSMGI